MKDYYSRYKVFFLLLMFFVFGVSMVSAWGPNTHSYIFDHCIEGENNTLITQIINDNLDACLVGLAYPDVGIFEYYTNFKAYQGLHNYNAVEEMLKIATNDRQRAFAYCYKAAHLAPDGVSHNFYIPEAIRTTKLPNYIIHPIKEISIEGRYINPKATRLMEGHEEFDDLVTQAVGRDWSDEAERLNVILGGGQFYDKAFTVQTQTTFGKVQKVFFGIVIHFVPEKESETLFVERSIDECKLVLRGETPDLDPSGYEALKQADRESALYLYLGTFIVIIIIFTISFKKRWIGFSRRR